MQKAKCRACGEPERGRDGHTFETTSWMCMMWNDFEERAKKNVVVSTFNHC